LRSALAPSSSDDTLSDIRVTDEDCMSLRFTIGAAATIILTICGRGYAQPAFPSTTRPVQVYQPPPSAESLLPRPGPATRPAYQPSTRPATGPAARPPTTGPAKSMSSDEMLGQLLRPAPGDGGGGADDAAAADAPGNSLPATGLREGLYVRDVSGHIAFTGEKRDPVFVVDGRRGGPPLVLLPCLTLMMMEDAITATKRDITFHVSGTATEYNGKNYLMLEQVTRGGRVLQGPLPPLTIDKKSGDGAVKPNAPAVNLVREGTYLVDRVGRLSRAPDGKRFEFTFDADGRALRDPPVILLPGQKLAALENAAASDNRDRRYRLSGLITEYRGRNYLLPEKVIVIPDIQQQL
jgi:hypothetical protein